MASRCRLITRWSSAVVLETDRDYAASGLKTGDSMSRADEQNQGAPPTLPGEQPVGFQPTTQSVSEPETVVLALMVAGGLMRWRKVRPNLGR